MPSNSSVSTLGKQTGIWGFMFIKAKEWKRPIPHSTRKCSNKPWHITEIEYYIEVSVKNAMELLEKYC